MKQDRRLTAIMFTDIAGYTALMGKDERKAHEMIRKNRKIQLTFIKKFKGRFLKEMGDGILASFPAATNAVSCAIAIQQISRKENIPLKIGIHEAEVLFENQDVIGDGVNIASRIEQATDAGCISISGAVFNEIRNKPDIETEFVGDKTFKNVETPVKIYRVLFDENGMPDPDLMKDNFIKKVKWQPAFVVSVGFVIVLAMLFLLIPGIIKKPSIELEKSIAVLPFDNESADENNAYFVNGMMEDIRSNLAKIGDLRVISKTSTEKYRNTSYSIREIAEELEVNFLLEGTVQKEGNRVKIHAQLINTGKDDHIWVETYLRDLSDVFTVQSEIAQAIAGALYAVISPRELEIIQTVPTEDITAYDIFLRARALHTIYWFDFSNRKALEEAVVLYRRALEYDSTYAQAYTGLALTYWNKHYWDQYFQATFLDSVLVLANKALSFDDHLDEAYYVRGMYYARQEDSVNKALRDFETALKINPNYSEVYHEKSILDAWTFEDFVEAIKNRRMAVKLDHSNLLTVSLRSLGNMYSTLGFNDLAKNSFYKAFQLDNDSLAHYNTLAWHYYGEENLREAHQSALKVYTIDSMNIFSIMCLMQFSSFLGNYEEANRFAIKLIQLYDRTSMRFTGDWHRIGFTFWKLGKNEEAEYYFNEQIRWCEESIKLGRSYAQTFGAHYDLACVLTFQGETERAFKLLEELNSKKFFPKWWIAQFTYEPFFDPIRDDERYQKILKDVTAKYEHERERVKVWLEAEKIL